MRRQGKSNNTSGFIEVDLKRHQIFFIKKFIVLCDNEISRKQYKKTMITREKKLRI